MVSFISHSCFVLDICSTSSSPSFQPIRSQIPIPTAHVMPSTAGTLASKLKPRASEEAQVSSSSSSSKSSLPKSASSPNLDAQHDGNLDTNAVQPDCLSRYRSLVNGLDHSLFPSGDQTRLDEAQKFEVPAMEPTLNQSALLGGLCHDVRQQLQMTRLGDNTGLLEQTYKVLPEVRAGLNCPLDPYGQRNIHPGSGASARMFSVPQGLQTQALLRDQASTGAYDPLLQERCGELASWQQQKQKLESLRLQVEQMQVRISSCLAAYEKGKGNSYVITNHTSKVSMKLEWTWLISTHLAGFIVHDSSVHVVPKIDSDLSLKCSQVLFIYNLLMISIGLFLYFHFSLF